MEQPYNIEKPLFNSFYRTSFNIEQSLWTAYIIINFIGNSNKYTENLKNTKYT